jgi:two-component system, chemotaxis family, protein-glutamate methylesterase/glutaminase
MIQVLIADTSPTIRQRLYDIIESQPDMCVVAQVSNGGDALLLTARLRPHLVLMGTALGPRGGHLATRDIMMDCPTPVIMMSDDEEQPSPEATVRVLQAGAMALSLYPGPDSSLFDAAMKSSFIEAVRLYAQVKPLRQHRRLAGAMPRADFVAARQQYRLVAIAASTGGPGALAQLLAVLPADYPLPILVVQHITTGFTEGLIHWLDSVTPLSVKLATEAEPLKNGTVYLAESGYHLEVALSQRLRLAATAPEGGFRPSANKLFRSAAQAYGERVLAVILTGMGSDGLEGLAEVRRYGGHILAQNEASSVVFGMPKAAIDAGLADRVLGLKEIADHLRSLATPAAVCNGQK